MGIIKVTTSDNYDVLPVDAAASYASKNKVNKLIIPDVMPGTWEINPDYNLQDGFAAIGKAVDASLGWVGFSVCFLKNQATGFTIAYQKHLDNLEAAGDITTDYRKWWSNCNAVTLNNFIAAGRTSIDEDGKFLHPAYLALRDLNEMAELDSYEVDFTYQSPIYTDQPNYYLNTTAGYDVDKRTKQTSQRTTQNFPGANEDKLGQYGAYGDNPWPKCSMNSFFSYEVVTNTDRLVLLGNQVGGQEECVSAQDEAWNIQWETIDPPVPE